MSKLKNHNSIEGQLLRDIFNNCSIDPYVTLLIESYIYKDVETYYTSEYLERGYLINPNKEDIKEQYKIRFEKKHGLHMEFYSPKFS